MKTLTISALIVFVFLVAVINYYNKGKSTKLWGIPYILEYTIVGDVSAVAIFRMVIYGRVGEKRWFLGVRWGKV